jgi:O-antigen chain-terminating methyltransferase
MINLWCDPQRDSGRERFLRAKRRRKIGGNVPLKASIDEELQKEPVTKDAGEEILEPKRIAERELLTRILHQQALTVLRLERELMMSRREATFERDRLREELETRNQERDRLREELESRNQERDRLREELESRNQERDRLREELESRNQERDRLREELESRNQERDRLREELETHNQEWDRRREELVSHNRERDRLYEEINSLRIHLNEILLSRSWQLSAPLRWVVTRIRKM